jgi:hypothetical protein
LPNENDAKSWNHLSKSHAHELEDYQKFFEAKKPTKNAAGEDLIAIKEILNAFNISESELSDDDVEID